MEKVVLLLMLAEFIDNLITFPFSNHKVYSHSTEFIYSDDEIKVQ